MLERARPIVRKYIGASMDVLSIRSLVHTLKEASNIPESTTLAVLDELLEQDVISVEGDVIKLLEQETHLINWSFYVGKVHFRIKVGTKR